MEGRWKEGRKGGSKTERMKVEGGKTRKVGRKDDRKVDRLKFVKMKRNTMLANSTCLVSHSTHPSP